MASSSSAGPSKSAPIRAALFTDSDSAGGGALTCGRVSGLWLGEAQPSPAFEGEVPANPIKWSLSIIPGGPSPSAFGAGFFDDAGDIPGTPILFYTLRGEFDASTGAVKIEKVYERPVAEGMKVTYEGKLKWEAGAGGMPSITGTWTNHAEGTDGIFGCVLQE